jgi:DNA-binding NtrC family response regulator
MSVPRGKILIVDDDSSIRKVLGFILEESGYEVRSAASGGEALGAIAKEPPDLVLTDIKMPGMDGIALLKQIRQIDDAIIVIVLTAFGSVETAVEAMKNGAADYLTKPISRDELTLTVEKTLRMRALEEENVSLRESIGERFDFANIVGLSPAMSAVFDLVRKVAATDASVLITGESGTGKELVARAIHRRSQRAHGPFVPVHTGAIPRELIAS